MSKTKSEMMRALRTRRKEAGLVKVECYVREEHKRKLAEFVEKELKGECKVKSK